MAISPTQFLNAMATRGARDLHVNACTAVLQHLDRVRYPVEAELQVPLAFLQDGLPIGNGTVDRVSMRIVVQGRVGRPALRTIRVNGILAPDLGVLCIVDERVTLTMTNDGDAVAVLIAAYGEAILPEVGAREARTPRQLPVGDSNILVRIVRQLLRWWRGG